MKSGVLASKSEINMCIDNFSNYAELTMVKEIQNKLHDFAPKTETEELSERILEVKNDL